MRCWVIQDFHLAKRQYDSALETNAEAYLPIVLSLVKLHIRSLWHTVTGGKNGLNLWSSDESDAGQRPTSLLLCTVILRKLVG
jgi:SEL1 protein